MKPEEQADELDTNRNKEESSASTATASPQMNVLDCHNCGNHDATSIVWIDGDGYITLCTICCICYETVRDGRGETGDINYADLTATDSISRTCVECGPAPARKTLRITEDSEAITIYCHGCNYAYQLDRREAKQIAANTAVDTGDCA